MQHYIQRRVGMGVSVTAFIVALVQFANSFFVLQKPFVTSLTEPSVLFVFLTGLIALFSGFYMKNAARIAQVSAAFFTAYASAYTTTSGELSYLVFMGIGFALALEYGFLEKKLVLKSAILLGILLSVLTVGMFFINRFSVLSIIHTLIGAAIVLYIFFTLIGVRNKRQAERTEILEREVALRTADLREEMETAKMLKEDLQVSLEEKNGLLQEKDILLKEVLHRTKNNMQLISSLLSLERNSIEDSSVNGAIEKSMNRITTLALAHELLYRSDNLTLLDLGIYTRRLSAEIWEDIFQNNRTVQIEVTETITINLDFAIPFGLILNELLNNAAFHAFPAGSEGTVRIVLKKSDTDAKLIFEDDGVGIPEEIDPETAGSLGFHIILSLLDQLRGTWKLHREKGTRWVITLPLPG